MKTRNDTTKSGKTIMLLFIICYTILSPFFVRYFVHTIRSPSALELKGMVEHGNIEIKKGKERLSPMYTYNN